MAGQSAVAPDACDSRSGRLQSSLAGRQADRQPAHLIVSRRSGEGHQAGPWCAARLQRQQDRPGRLHLWACAPVWGEVPLLSHTARPKGLAAPDASAAAVEQSGLHTCGGSPSSDVAGCSSAVDSCSAIGRGLPWAAPILAAQREVRWQELVAWGEGHVGTRGFAVPGILPGGEAGCRDGALSEGHVKPGLGTGPAVLLQLIKVAGLEVQAHCSRLHAVQQLLHLQWTGAHWLNGGTSCTAPWHWPSLGPAQAGQPPLLPECFRACSGPTQTCPQRTIFGSHRSHEPGCCRMLMRRHVGVTTPPLRHLIQHA